LIHHLDAVDKHRLLLTVGIAYELLIFDAAEPLRELADWTKDLPVMPLGIRPAERYPVQEGHHCLPLTPTSLRSTRISSSPLR
jgi:hypothetical protein